MHPPRTVPLEETLSAVQVAVMSGRVRYAGMVAPRGWQLATVAERGRALGSITVPVSAQVEYSLLSRDAEAELLPAATHHGVGLLAWAPLGIRQPRRNDLPSFIASSIPPKPPHA